MSPQDLSACVETKNKFIYNLNKIVKRNIIRNFKTETLKY